MNLHAVVCVLALCIVLIAGCLKKKSETEIAPSVDNGQTTEANATAKQGDSATNDVFAEFYNDSTQQGAAPKAPAKKSGKATTKIASSPNSEGNFNGPYCIQVASVNSRKVADKIAASLQSKQYPVYIVDVQDPAPSVQGLYHRVRIGGFTSLSKAKEFSETNLRSEGYTSFWITSRGTDHVSVSTEPGSSVSSVKSGAPAPTKQAAPAATAEPAPKPATPPPAKPAPAPANQQPPAPAAAVATPAPVTPTPPPAPPVPVTPGPVQKAGQNQPLETDTTSW